jgi:hypothetical protein
MDLLPPLLTEHLQTLFWGMPHAAAAAANASVVAMLLEE